MDYSDEKLGLEDLFQGRPFINIYEQDAENLEGVITESDLKTFFRCPHAYFLKRHAGLNRVPKSAQAAMALLFQQARKSLYNLRTSGKMRTEPYEKRAGPDKKRAEEMTEAELRRHMASSSAEAFGNTIGAKWMFFTAKGKYAGSPLALHYDKERFTAKAELIKAAKNYFEFAVRNGAPILGFMNTNETIEFEGHKLNATLPEVRRGMIIDDPTIYNFNADGVSKGIRKDMTEEQRLALRQKQLDASPLVTLRIVAICTTVREYGQQYAHKLRIPDEIADEWDANGTLADQRIRYRHFNATDDRLLETHRDMSHIDELKRRIDQFLEGTSRQEFPPNKSRCYGCQYNVMTINREVACRHANPAAKPSMHIKLYDMNGKNGNGKGDEGNGEKKEEPQPNNPADTTTK
jgi:hypothetical protein